MNTSAKAIHPVKIYCVFNHPAPLLTLKSADSLGDVSTTSKPINPFQNEIQQAFLLENNTNIPLPADVKGGNFPEIHRAKMLFKAWLRGIYHSVRYLQTYIDEYTYRFNRHLTNASIFDNLITRMIKAKPYYM